MLFRNLPSTGNISSIWTQLYIPPKHSPAFSQPSRGCLQPSTHHVFFFCSDVLLSYTNSQGISSKSVCQPSSPHASSVVFKHIFGFQLPYCSGSDMLGKRMPHAPCGGSKRHQEHRL